MAKRREQAAPETQGDLNPFLKAKDIAADGDELKLSGWINRRQGSYGEQIVMEVHHARLDKVFDFGIGVGSPNHKRLFKMFGADEQKWAGKSIMVQVQSNRGITFISVTGGGVSPAS